VGDMLADEIRDRAMSIPGITDVQVEFTFEPLWTPERISEEGRQMLRRLGFLCRRIAAPLCGSGSG